MSRLHGCHNRRPLVDTAVVQDGYSWPTPTTRLPRMVKIPDPMTKECQHTKHAPDDQGCAGCRWKETK